MKEIWERSQKCDLCALHLINKFWKALIKHNFHQFSTPFVCFFVVSSVLGVIVKNCVQSLLVLSLSNSECHWQWSAATQMSDTSCGIQNTSCTSCLSLCMLAQWKNANLCSRYWKHFCGQALQLQVKTSETKLKRETVTVR